MISRCFWLLALAALIVLGTYYGFKLAIWLVIGVLWLLFAGRPVPSRSTSLVITRSRPAAVCSQFPSSIQKQGVAGPDALE
jgi:hypothetical protein